MNHRGPCGKVVMTKTFAREVLRKHENTTHDRTMQVYYCRQCDAFHVGHVKHDPMFMHLQWRERKWKRRRGRRRYGQRFMKEMP